MTNVKLGRWLLVALAIVGLALAAPAVSAHDNATTTGDTHTDNATADEWNTWMGTHMTEHVGHTTADDAPAHNATADEWNTWMEAQMIEHMGPGSVQWMESHVGVPADQMPQNVTDDDHDDLDDHDDGAYRQGHC